MAIRRRRGSGNVIGEIVVVFDRFKGYGFAEESQVVYWNWVWEERLNGIEHAKT